MYWVSMAESWPGGFWEGRPGLSHVGYSWFQAVPMNSPQGTVEPIRKDGGTCEKTYFRKGNILDKPKRRKNKQTNTHCDKNQHNHTGQRRMRAKELCSRSWRRDLPSLTRPVESPTVYGEDRTRVGIYTAACGQPAVEQIFSWWRGLTLEWFLQGCSLGRGGKAGGRKSREGLLWTGCNILFPTPCDALGMWTGADDEKEEVLGMELGKKGKGKF